MSPDDCLPEPGTHNDRMMKAAEKIAALEAYNLQLKQKLAKGKK
jgi:hypothetical protein